MKKNLILLILFFSTQMIFSQVDFRKGFIINNSGDTIYGTLNYREGSYSYKYCLFRKSLNDSIIKYIPTSIKGYGFIGDKAYESRTVLSLNQAKEDEIAFFEVLSRGIITLYRYDKDFYALKADTTFYRLYKKRKETDVDGFKSVTYAPTYIGYLNLLMFDSPACLKRIPDIGFDEKSLTKLVEFYNGEKNVSSVSYKSGKPWTSCSLGISGGMSISKLSFSADEAYSYTFYYMLGSFSTSTSPFIDLSIELSSPRLSEHISFRTDMILYNTKYSSYVYSHIYYHEIRYFTTLDVTQLKVPVGLCYYFRLNKYTPYVNVGVTATFPFKTRNRMLTEENHSGVVTSYTDEEIIKTNIQGGVWGNVGVERPINKRLAGYIEFRSGESFGQYDQKAGLSSKTSCYQLCLGIKTKR
jgi:hypothetical protein